MAAYRTIYHNKIYKKLRIEYGFSKLEIKRIYYTITILFYELTKLILLCGLFTAIGKFPDFFICSLCLLPLRIFSGGLHMKHYVSCLIFSILFFTVPICILGKMQVSPHWQVISLSLATIFTSLVGPVSSLNRPALSGQKYRKYMVLSCFIMSGYTLLFAFWQNIPSRNPLYWILMLQLLQLLCAKLARKGVHNEKSKIFRH